MMEKRGPRKVTVDHGRPSMYKLYKKSVDNPVSSSTYSVILNDFNKAISKEMLENAFEYILPFRLGIIRIKKYKAHYKVDEETGKIMKKLNQKKNWFIILMSILMAISISGISVITVLIVLISQHIALFLLGLIKEN